MTEKDYTIFAPIFDDPRWHIAKNDETATYTVTISDENGDSCDCPFHVENAEFHVCKHTVRIREEIRIREMEELAEEAEREEAWEGRGVLA